MEIVMKNWPWKSPIFWILCFIFGFGSLWLTTHFNKFSAYAYKNPNDFIFTAILLSIVFGPIVIGLISMFIILIYQWIENTKKLKRKEYIKSDFENWLDS